MLSFATLNFFGPFLSFSFVFLNSGNAVKSLKTRLNMINLLLVISYRSLAPHNVTYKFEKCYKHNLDGYK